MSSSIIFEGGSTSDLTDLQTDELSNIGSVNRSVDVPNVTLSPSEVRKSAVRRYAERIKGIVKRKTPSKEKLCEWYDAYFILIVYLAIMIIGTIISIIVLFNVPNYTRNGHEYPTSTKFVSMTFGILVSFLVIILTSVAIFRYVISECDNAYEMVWIVVIALVELYLLAGLMSVPLDTGHIWHHSSKVPE
jgi:magnesium-transporting ATPase (P-type)